uniref:Dopamine beta-hydroxylase n=1 Tax=Tetraodon nigroviridis TaxID=99883 RepID=H3D6P9_TETNG
HQETCLCSPYWCHLPWDSAQDVTIMYFTALAALLVILVASYQGALPPLPMPFHISLDPRGELHLAWNISYASQMIYMELRVAKLQQGVLLGMSDQGELTNADLVLLWNTGTKSYFGDAWSDSEGHVSLDSQQDYELLEAQQKPDGYHLLFRRAFSTCDPRDYLIQEGTVHIIYGFLDGPLSSLEQLNLSRIHTGVQRVLMLRPDTPPPALPPDVQTFEVRAPNVVIPAQETTYWCFIQTLPENMPRNHIVMYESVITPGNEAIVHHIEVFECSPDVQTVPDYSGSCDDKMKPRQLNFCRHVLAAWAMGAEAFYYPPEAGLPVGGAGSSRYLRLEVHYHNPLLISGRRDSSGIRLHYTPSLRRYDAGIMELGLVYTPIMAVPPKQHTFYLSGYCSSKCTQAALPSGGIFIFASQLHTHLAGRAVRTVLVRGGSELEVVQEDQHFSAHYQPIRTLRKAVHVLPGDVLITKCTFNTEDRSKPTVGGFGIMEEMCVNYVHYYPRTMLELCKTHVDMGYLQKFFNAMSRFQGSGECVCGELSVTQQYAQVHWNAFAVEVLDSLYNTAPISMHCNQSDARSFPGDWDQQPLPAVTSTLGKPHYPCKARGPPSGATPT